MDEARRLTGCDAVVVAMSGDFVQRGEPAVTDKWARTEAALDCGADLVIEIPVLFCLGNASQYAGASVSLLEASGCSRIAFGSESGDAGLIEKTADTIRAMGDSLSEGIVKLSKEGLSYPAARSRVYAALRKGSASSDEIERELSVLSEPNDILALEYILSMGKARPLAVNRRGASHGGSTGDEPGYRSATAIRCHLAGCREEDHCPDILSEWMPEASLRVLKAAKLTFRDEWTPVLRYALMSSDPSVTDDCPSGGEGLGRLLKKAAHTEDSFEGIIAAAKSRRYTYTRISRLCMQTVLGITRTKYPFTGPAYIRVLGFNDKGRQLLSEIKKDASCSLPVITNINREDHKLSDDALRLLGLDIHAADIYNLVTGRDAADDSDHVKSPVMRAAR